MVNFAAEETPKPEPAFDHKVADLGLAALGRKEIERPRSRCPDCGAALKTSFGSPKPFTGAPHRRRVRCNINHPDRGAHRDPVELGAEVPLGLLQTSSRPRTRSAAAIAAAGTRVRLEGRDARGVLVGAPSNPALARVAGPQHDPRRRRDPPCSCTSAWRSTARRAAVPGQPPPPSATPAPPKPGAPSPLRPLHREGTPIEFAYCWPHLRAHPGREARPVSIHCQRHQGAGS